MLYLILKWVHVLAAIVAIGSNVTYGIWLARAARRPEALPFTLGGIQLIDNRLANPAYILLLLSGLSMVYVGNLSLSIPWLLTSLILYVVLSLVGLLLFTPTLRKQIRLLESQGPSSPEYQAAANRGTIIGIVIAVLAVTIVFLMVTKPPLWA
jgi:uncharacterized membrane protein